MRRFLMQAVAVVMVLGIIGATLVATVAASVGALEVYGLLT